MEKNKDLTAIIISTIIGIITIVSFSATYITKITSVEVQLVAMKESLLNIETKLNNYDEKLNSYNERLLILEQWKGK